MNRQPEPADPADKPMFNLNDLTTEIPFRKPVLQISGGIEQTYPNPKPASLPTMYQNPVYPITIGMERRSRNFRLRAQNL